MSGLAETTSAWLLFVPLAAVAAVGVHSARRRHALNEALHELRRPLQAIALGGGDEHGSVDLAAAALDRLDREINGGSADRRSEPLALEPLAAAAVRRWQGWAGRRGARLRLSWGADHALVVGDREALSQAIDNLVVNAIEHGGNEIEVRSTRSDESLVLAVADSGAGAEGKRRESSRAAIARLTGRARRGHGLGVVDRVAGEHGGRFSFRQGGEGSVATLVLPLGDRGHGP